jgi:hypothetical protein
MNANAMKSLKLLALSALVLAGCDPFTKAPGGTPRVDRAIATGSIVQEAASTADQADILVDDVTLDATLNLWFNVALDPTTVQALPNVDSTGAANNPAAATNAMNSPLTTKIGFGGTDTIVYQPGSAVNGGIVQAISGGVWAAGDHVLGGTVKDLYGTTGTFRTTFRVSFIPVFVATDPYTIDMAWANDITASGYTVQFQAVTDARNNAANPNTLAWATLSTGVAYSDPFPVSQTTGTNSAYRVAALTPGTDYWFRVLPEGSTQGYASTANMVSTAAQPRLKATGNPVGASGPQPGVVNLSWARVRRAAYTVQSSANGNVWTNVDPSVTPMYDVSTSTPVAVTNPIAASPNNPYVLELRAVPVGTYYYRIVPSWTGAVGARFVEAAAGPGSPITIKDPGTVSVAN